MRSRAANLALETAMSIQSLLTTKDQFGNTEERIFLLWYIAKASRGKWRSSVFLSQRGWLQQQATDRVQGNQLAGFSTLKSITKKDFGESLIPPGLVELGVGSGHKNWTKTNWTKTMSPPCTLLHTIPSSSHVNTTLYFRTVYSFKNLPWFLSEQWLLSQPSFPLFCYCGSLRPLMSLNYASAT